MKRLVEIVFWMGVLCACVPLLMHTFGWTRQVQLRHEWAQASTASAAGTPDERGDDSLIRLTIPRMNVSAVVMSGTGETALAQGPGHFQRTAQPGQVGNCAIAAHRNLWGCWFANLDEMTPGDQIILETVKHHFVYRVTGQEVVSPTDSAILRPHGKKREVTLVTCTIPASRRIVVHGVLDRVDTT
jgi:sortase A